MRLSFELVRDWHEAKDLMKVRNECRHGMTGNTEVITEAQQRKFFDLEIKTGRYLCYVLYDYGMGMAEAIGYGIIKREDAKRCWMTAGLVEHVRGRGLSRFIIAAITQYGYGIAESVWIHVYDDNLALRGDIREGYELVASEFVNGKLRHTMKHNRDRRLKGWQHHRIHGDELIGYGSEWFEYDQYGAIVRREIEEVDAISREFMPQVG